MSLSAAAKLDRVIKTGDWPTEVLSIFPPPRPPRRRAPRHRAASVRRWDLVRIRQDATLILSCSCSAYLAGYLVSTWT